MLTFVARHEMFSTYREPSGDLVYLPHGRLADFDRDEANQIWGGQKFTGWRARDAFLTLLRTMLIEPYIADEIAWCDQCGDLDLRENGNDTSGGWACESCIANYYSWCESCEEYATDTRNTLNDQNVCGNCLDRCYYFCDDCDGYYYQDDCDDHQHDGDGCCKSPAVDFAVRNDGDPMLPNDVRVTVSLPAGTIDNEGLQRIRFHLHDVGMYEAAGLVPSLGDKWQTREGNFTKRLSRLVYKSLAQKVPPAVLSQVGCIAREHSTSVDFAIEVTRNLNMSAEDFAHEESCWWASYSASRCALKTNGGFGLRTFDAYGDVCGRAWVMPLRSPGSTSTTPTLVPTFNTLTPDAFIVFNGYGNLDGYSAARIISYMAGWTYRKINFRCAPMFVNSDSGYLIAPEDIAAKYTDGSLYLEVDQHSNLFDTESNITEKEYAHG